MNRERLLSRLAKIKLLADQSPVEGERNAAACRLAAALEKHGVTEAELSAFIAPRPKAPVMPFNPWGSGVQVVIIRGSGGFGFSGFGFGNTGTSSTVTGWTTL